MRLPLKVGILRSGETQRSVSIETRIPETRLSDIVRGKSEPTESERLELARVLGESVAELFPSEGTERS